jgi:hypothetical protein
MLDTSNRVQQTMPTKSSYQQTDLEKGTQTATSGFHVCTGDDKAVTGSPKRYIKASDFKIQQIKAVRKYHIVGGLEMQTSKFL